MTEPIKTALCSFGMSGWVFHAPFINTNNNFELYAVVERSKNLAVEKFPNIITYRSIDALLADDKVELVIVNTPNNTHFEFAQKALLANKHVVVEKPFTNTVAEAKALVELAKQQNKILSVYHNRRWDSDFLTVKQIVESGKLGNIVEAEIHFDRFKQELSPKAHKEIPSAGAGILHDLGSHIIDQALQLFGKPQAVYADLRIIRPISQVHDYMHVTLHYSNLRVHLKASYLVKETLPAYVLHGSNGSFIKSRADVQENMLQQHQSPLRYDWGKEPETEDGILNIIENGKDIRQQIPTLQGNYMHFYDNLFHTIRNNTSIAVKPEEALTVIQVIEKAFESSNTKQVIPFS